MAHASTRSPLLARSSYTRPNDSWKDESMGSVDDAPDDPPPAPARAYEHLAITLFFSPGIRQEGANQPAVGASQPTIPSQAEAIDRNTVPSSVSRELRTPQTLIRGASETGFSAEICLQYYILGSLASVFFSFSSSILYLVTEATNIGSFTLLFNNLSDFSILLLCGIIVYCTCVVI